VWVPEILLHDDVVAAIVDRVLERGRLLHLDGPSIASRRVVPMPPSEVWATWAHEAIGRLDALEPIAPAKRTRPGREGLAPSNWYSWKPVR